MCSFFTLDTEDGMEAYTDFAKAYSLMMQDIPYEKWEKYLTGILKENGIGNGLLLDLGCGTGEMTRRMRTRGYDMIGVDSSPEMLDEAYKNDAKEKREFQPSAHLDELAQAAQVLTFQTTLQLELLPHP